MPEMMTTQVPLEKAYTLMQTTTERATVVTSKDQIGLWQHVPGAPAGQIIEFRLNPTKLPGTRMSSLAANFVRFRFKRASIIFKPNSGTNQNGSVVIGFAADSNKQIGPGSLSASTVFQLPGAADAPLFVLTKSDAAIEKKPNWLKITDTGDDINTTEQGTFFIATSSAPTVTGALQVPIFLDYEIEFLESTAPAPAGALAWPSTQFVSRTNGGIVGGGLMAVVIAAGETLPLPAFPANRYFLFNPALELENIDAAADPIVKVEGVVYNGTGFQFYSSRADYDKVNPLVFLACASDVPTGNQAVPRSSVVQVN
jgi:hypothetical protein